MSKFTEEVENLIEDIQTPWSKTYKFQYVSALNQLLVERALLVNAIQNVRQYMHNDNFQKADDVALVTLKQVGEHHDGP